MSALLPGTFFDQALLRDFYAVLRVFCAILHDFYTILQIPREGNHVDSQFPQVGVQLAWEPSSSVENVIVVGNEL